MSTSSTSRGDGQDGEIAAAVTTVDEKDEAMKMEVDDAP
jgi:hypothetical protein